MEKGTFVVVEGIDGCGKTSHIEKLYEKLTEQGKKVVIINNIKEGSTTGKAIREMLVKENDTINDLRMVLLYLSELQYVSKCKDGIEDLLNQGYIVLCSRFFYSTYAYAGTTNTIREIIRLSSLNLPEPDLTFYLNVNIKTAMARLGKNGDFFEKKEKLLIIKNRYEKLIDENMITNVIRLNNETNFKIINNALLDIIVNASNLKNSIEKIEG